VDVLSNIHISIEASLQIWPYLLSQ